MKSLDVRLRRAMGQGMPPEPRPEVIDLPPAVHGSLNLGELQSLGLRPEEVLVFKLCDTDRERVQWTAHTAFDDPASPPDAAPRRSIELRTLAFFPGERG